MYYYFDCKSSFAALYWTLIQNIFFSESPGYRMALVILLTSVDVYP